jgi:signal transduction histidine kinase
MWSEERRSPEVVDVPVPVPLQKVLDSLPFYVLLVDGEHRILAANRAVREDLDVNLDDVICGFCPKVIHGRDDDYPGCPLTEALERGGEEVVERSFFDTDINRWMRSGIYPIGMRTAEGSPVFLHFARDVTDQHDRDAKLERSLEHHEALNKLFEALQACQTTEDALSTLIRHVLGVSWIGLESRACGFTTGANGLEMVVENNLGERHAAICRTLELGECLCGRVAETGKAIYRQQLCDAHTVRYDGIEDHGHAVLPLSHGGDLLAVVNFYLPPHRELDDSQTAFLEATCAATAGALASIQARNEARVAQEKMLGLERKLLARIIESQEDERKRIARELHDQLGQTLSAALLQLDSSATDEQRAGEPRGELQQLVRQMIDQVRRMAAELRPSILDRYGLHSALERYTQELAARSQTKVDYESVGSTEQDERLGSEIEVALYRIAQEALNNVIRHAAATRISVILLREPRAVSLLVEDDGEGFDVGAVREHPDEKCLGLIGMEERANLVGGELVIESAPAKGTVIRAEIPLDR